MTTTIDLTDDSFIYDFKGDIQVIDSTKDMTITKLKSGFVVERYSSVGHTVKMKQQMLESVGRSVQSFT